MEASAPPKAPGGGRDGRTARGAQEFRAYARERLIESRLTPNASSIAGFVLKLVAAVLITQNLFFLAGVALNLGSVMDRLDRRYSRVAGKGTLIEPVWHVRRELAAEGGAPGAPPTET